MHSNRDKKKASTSPCCTIKYKGTKQIKTVPVVHRSHLKGGSSLTGIETFRTSEYRDIENIRMQRMSEKSHSQDHDKGWG